MYYKKTKSVEDSSDPHSLTWNLRQDFFTKIPQRICDTKDTQDRYVDRTQKLSIFLPNNHPKICGDLHLKILQAK